MFGNLLNKKTYHRGTNEYSVFFLLKTKLIFNFYCLKYRLPYIIYIIQDSVLQFVKTFFYLFFIYFLVEKNCS